MNYTLFNGSVKVSLETLARTKLFLLSFNSALAVAGRPQTYKHNIYSALKKI